MAVMGHRMRGGWAIGYLSGGARGAGVVIFVIVMHSIPREFAQILP
jgi:hypothetical protein